ncbi:MAG: hypothetical protein IIA67_08760, partial [Planctomycetes bacterium]|nr:hypothetical protein [Planctomycetota bacterium]
MSKQFDPYHRWLGIPPDHQPPDYYRLLGVDRFEDSADVIANSADRQATHVRTFQDGPHSELARKLLADISKVKVCLLDPEKKAVYDARLQSKMSRRQGPSIVRATPLTAAQQASGQPKANDTLQAQPLEMSRAADSPPHIDTSLDRRARLGKKSLGGIAAVGCVLAVVVVLVATGFEPETLPESAEAQDSDTGDADTPTSESAANSKTDRIQGGDQEETPPSTAEGEKSTDEGPSAGASNSKPAQASEQPKPSDNDLPPDDDQKAPDPLDATSPEEEDEGSDPRTLPLTIKAAPKVSIPADAKLQPAVVDVKRVYRLTKRTPPAETATIAADILKSAGGEPRGTAIHYAMLLVARDAAVSTGNFNVALSAIGQLDAAYELDAWSLRFAALERIAKTAPRSPRLVQLVDVLVSQVEGAAADDRYRIATSLASLAAAKARQTRDKERIRAVAGVLTAVRRRRKDYDKTIAPARAALRADPNDPEANLVVGMYEVLQKGRWQQGLPMLAKCSDSSIVAAAQLDLASPDGPPQQVKVADAWYAAGKAKKSQQALLGRA